MGATAFGGNVALVAAIRNEITTKRKWISDQTVLDLMVIGNILPGPLATNIVFACGKILRGIPGAFVALIGVVLPSFILMCIMSWVYFTIGSNPSVTAVMNGIIPCVAGIIAATAWSLYRQNVKGIVQNVLVAGALTAMLLWTGFYLTLTIVILAAIAGRVFFYKPGVKIKVESGESAFKAILVPAGVFVCFAILFFVPDYSAVFAELKTLSLAFASMSITLFGGGYVFIPAMQKVVVNQMAWLTSREFSEGIALGQVTPGPIMISSVFIGWKVAGLKGAAVAAVSIFTPPAALMYLAHHFMEKMKTNRTAEAVFAGVRPAVIGMIFASVWVVFASGSVDFFSAGIFVVTVALMIWKDPEPIFLIIGAGLLGWLIW